MAEEDSKSNQLSSFFRQVFNVPQGRVSLNTYEETQESPSSPSDQIPFNAIRSKGKGFHFNIFSPTLGVIAIGVFGGFISLFSIALGLSPISRQAKLWNRCVETTSTFLSSVPSFATTDIYEIEAMSVNLCNGSTPQKTPPSP